MYKKVNQLYMHIDYMLYMHRYYLMIETENVNENITDDVKKTALHIKL